MSSVDPMAASIRELAASIYDEKVARARRISESRKFWAGAELFDIACDWSMTGIKAMHPDADEAELRKRLQDRLRIRRDREQPREQRRDLSARADHPE